MTSYKWTDGMILEAMHLREVRGFKTPHVAELMTQQTGHHISKSGICGLMFRVNAATDKHSDLCHKTANKDGGMKPKWWDDGQARDGT